MLLRVQMQYHFSYYCTDDEIRISHIYFGHTVFPIHINIHFFYCRKLRTMQNFLENYKATQVTPETWQTQTTPKTKF